MHENQIAEKILDAAFHIHRTLGPGLLESVYEVILAKQLEKAGLKVRRQVQIAIEFERLKFDEGFRADLIVADKVIVEIKSIEALAPVHPKQVLTYLRLTGLKLGLLINFNEDLLKKGIRRVVNGLEDEH
jgi:GxxExxY protein